MAWYNRAEQKTPHWIWITDFIPITNDRGFLEGFKRYKRHRFNENNVKLVFFDEDKRPFFGTRGYLTTADVAYRYSRYIYD